MHSGISTLTPIYCDNLGKEAIAIKSAKKNLYEVSLKVVIKVKLNIFYPIL